MNILARSRSTHADPVVFDFHAIMETMPTLKWGVSRTSMLASYATPKVA